MGRGATNTVSPVRARSPHVGGVNCNRHTPIGQLTSYIALAKHPGCYVFKPMEIPGLSSPRVTVDEDEFDALWSRLSEEFDASPKKRFRTKKSVWGELQSDKGPIIVSLADQVVIAFPEDASVNFPRESFERELGRIRAAA